MSSSNNVQTMFAQHYSEKGPPGVGMWQLATSGTAEQNTGVQWRSLCTMPMIGVTVINGDPNCGNIWITRVCCWRYL
jgi:hypothetical protein